MNKITSGKYFEETSKLGFDGKNIFIMYMEGFRFEKISLNNDNVEKIVILDREESLSLKSSIGRGLVGGAILGGIGVLGGVLTSKTKESNMIEIKYKDGESSTAIVDKGLFRRFISEFEVI